MIVGADVFANEVLLFLERNTVDIFELLADDLGSGKHSVSSTRIKQKELCQQAR